jgi:hypothetical protein
MKIEIDYNGALACCKVDGTFFKECERFDQIYCLSAFDCIETDFRRTNNWKGKDPISWYLEEKNILIQPRPYADDFTKLSWVSEIYKIEGTKIINIKNICPCKSRKEAVLMAVKFLENKE